MVEELEIEEVKLFEDLDPRLVKIKKCLPNDFKEKLIEPLKKYHECFNWIVPEMSRIDLEIACHRLVINLSIKPV